MTRVQKAEDEALKIYNSLFVVEMRETTQEKKENVISSCQQHCKNLQGYLDAIEKSIK